MEVVWFAQSVDNETLDVVRSGEMVEDSDRKRQLIEDAQKGVSIPREREFEVKATPFNPFTFRGFLRPDRKSANGRARIGIFKVAYERADSTADLVQAVGWSLERLGLESSDEQKRRFLDMLNTYIEKWRKRFRLFLTTAIVAGAVAAAAGTVSNAKSQALVKTPPVAEVSK